MKRIELFDKYIRGEIEGNLSEHGINHTLYWAYQTSLEAKNDTIDFNNVIWADDVEPIIDACKKYGFERITISSTFSSMNSILWQFLERGCTVEGMQQVNMRFKNIWTGKRDQQPAIMIKI